MALRANPISPSPGQIFTVTADTQFNPAEAIFTWIINDRVRPELSGLGKNKAEFQAGNNGTTFKIRVNARHPIWGEAVAIQTFTVTDVSLTWSADTYIPRWYKGKALPVPGSIVTVTATPEIILNGARVPTEQLIFHWLVNGPAEIRAGRGMNSIKLLTSDNPLNTLNVKIRIEDATGGVLRVLKETGNLFIKTADGQISVYQSNPLGGINPHSAIKTTVYRSSNNSGLQAEPFFLPIKSKKELKYKWTIGGIEITGTPQFPWLISIDATGQQPNVTEFPVNLWVEHPSDKDIFLSKKFTLFNR
jgi:hypothetical protein